MFGMNEYSVGFYVKEIEKLSKKIMEDKKEIKMLNDKLIYEDYSYYIEKYETRINELGGDIKYCSVKLTDYAEDLYFKLSCENKETWIEKKVLQSIATTRSRLEDKKGEDDYKQEYAQELSEYLHKGYAIFRETPMEEEVCNELVFIGNNVFDTWKYIKENMKSYIEGEVLRVKEVGGVWITGKRVKG